MRKIVLIDDLFPKTGEQTQEPVLQLRWGNQDYSRLTKTASEAVDYIKNVQSEPGKTRMLLLALGAEEAYGPNRNGDGFNEYPVTAKVKSAGRPYWVPPGEGLTDHYQSFEKNPAHTFLHHCFPAGTPILLADRSRKPIEHVQVGEEVVTRDGPRAVTGVMQRAYRGPGIKLRLKGEYLPLTGTEDHPVQVFRREQLHCPHRYNRLASVCGCAYAACKTQHGNIGDPQWVPLREVLPGDYLILPVPAHGDKTVNPAFARLVGWVASEGHLGKRGMIQFTFSSNGVDCGAVKTCLEENGLHVSVTPRPQYDTTMLSTCSKEFHARLSDYIVGTYNEKHLTQAILTWDRVSLQHMLGAYISGDGHIPAEGRNAGQLRIRSSSPQMLRILADVVRALGVPATVQWDSPVGTVMRSPTNGQLYAGNGSGVVSVEPAFSPEIAQFSRKCVRRSVRTPHQKILGKVHLLQVTETDDVDLDEQVYNLEVAGPQHYVANEVFVHNCNKDPAKSSGHVEKAFFNPKMHRVELLVVVDNAKDPEWVQRVNDGDFPAVSMGCFRRGTPILLASGRLIAIENIKKGDLVITHTGRIARVTSTMVRHHTGTIYRVKPYGHREPLELTGEHPLWLAPQANGKCRPSSKTVNRGRLQRHCTPLSGTCNTTCAGCTTKPRFAFDWTPTEAAQEGDYLATPLPTFSVTTTFTRAEARLLGYYLAEGWVTHSNKRNGHEDRYLQLCTGLHETETHAELYQLSDQLGATSITENDVEERNGKYINIWDQRLAQLCTEHCGEGAATKRLSSSVMGADPSILLELLGAYANGDGGAYDGSLYFSTASLELAEQLQIVLARCGMISSINRIVHKPSKKSVVKSTTIEYQVWVDTDTASLLTTSRLALRGSNVANNKRFFVEQDGVTYLVTPIQAIEEFPYDDLVYNFSVEEDESYVAHGFAVHNCRIKRDVCAICGNEAPTRADYCDHAKFQMNQILPDGRKCYVHNPSPSFFDISRVFRPADRTGYTLKKVAFESSAYEIRTGAEMGDLVERLANKAAAIGKLSDIIKRVPVKPVKNFQDYATSHLGPVDSIPRDVLAAYSPREVFSTLNKLGMALTLREFMQYLPSKIAGSTIVVPDSSIAKLAGYVGDIYSLYAQAPAFFEKVAALGVFNVDSRYVSSTLEAALRGYAEKRGNISGMLSRVIPEGIGIRQLEAPMTDMLSYDDPSTGEKWKTTRGAAVQAHDAIAKQQLMTMMGGGGLLYGAYKALGTNPLLAAGLGVAGARLGRPDMGPQVHTNEGPDVSQYTEFAPSHERTAAFIVESLIDEKTAFVKQGNFIEKLSATVDTLSGLDYDFDEVSRILGELVF